MYNKKAYQKFYEEHRDELRQKQRERYYQKKNGGTDCMSPYKVKKRLENQDKNYNFNMMKFHLEEWAAQEKTSVMEQCYKYCCLREYFDYRTEHPEYDNSSPTINKALPINA